MAMLPILILLTLQIPARNFEGADLPSGHSDSRGYGRTLVVDGSGEWDHTSIQEAVMEAEEGDTVYVKAGVYRETEINIDVSISIIGDGKEKTTITIPDTDPDSTILIVGEDRVNISGLTMDASNGSGECIKLFSAENCRIANNTFISANCCLDVLNAKDIRIKDNRMITEVGPGSGLKGAANLHSCSISSLEKNEFDNGGISLLYSTDITVKDNVLWNNTASGVLLYKCHFCEVRGNEVNDSDYGIKLYRSTNAYLSNNVCINNNYNGISVEYSNSTIIDNNTCSNNQYNGIMLDNSENNNISHNILSNNGDAIGIYNSCYNSGLGNVFEGSGIDVDGDCIENWLTNTMKNNTLNGRPVYYWTGEKNRTVPENAGEVFLVNCSNVTVKDIISDVGRIDLAFSKGCNVMNNSFPDGSKGRIDLDHCEDCMVTSNSFAKSQAWGINIDDSENTTIIDNRIYSTLYSGIRLDNSNNSIVDNNICSNTEVAGIAIWDCGNVIISNNICNNNSYHGIFGRSLINSLLNNNTCNHNNISGISLWGSGYYANELSGYNISIHDNILKRNKVDGIYLGSCYEIRLSGNMMHECGLLLDFRDAERFNNFDIDSSNTVNGKPLIFWKGVIDKEVPPGAGQVILYSCMGVKVTGQAIDNATVGIHVISSAHCRIANNTCSHNTHAGIFLYDTDETAIIGNICNGNILKPLYYYDHMYPSGIVLEDSKSNTLVNNKCDDNENSGIWCNGFTHNTIVNNSCCENGKDGMYIGFDLSHYNYGICLAKA